MQSDNRTAQRGRIRKGLVIVNTGHDKGKTTVTNIAAVCGAGVAVLPHPHNGRPTVLPN
jgi:ATP:corrinoid adenosyltransferase